MNTLEWYQEIADDELKKVKNFWKMKGDYEMSFIYHLIDTDIGGEDHPVYIGQTKNFVNRIKYHEDENVKKFDFYTVEVIDNFTINDIEALQIVRYLPKYNFSIPENNCFFTLFNLIKSARDCEIKATSNEIKKRAEQTRSLIVGSYRYWYGSDIIDYYNQKLRGG